MCVCIVGVCVIVVVRCVDGGSVLVRVCVGLVVCVCVSASVCRGVVLCVRLCVGV